VTGIFAHALIEVDVLCFSHQKKGWIVECAKIASAAKRFVSDFGKCLAGKLNKVQLFL